MTNHTGAAEERRVIFASSLGTVFEWYDFYLYGSLSLPYHIGNGWFGGFLPPTAFAIVAATGNMYSGLWYPIVVAAFTLVIGLLFVRETTDVDIYAKD